MFTGSSILLLVALLIILGSLGGELARRIHLPALAGQIVVGILLGESFLHLMPESQQDAFGPLVVFALSLVGVTIGGHLEFRRLHNARRRIILITVCQTMIAFVAVFSALIYFQPLDIPEGYHLPVYLVLASIATSTSPVSTMHIIKEKRAKGLLVKTTIAVIALNNLVTIAAFEGCRAVSLDMLSKTHTLLETFLPATAGILISILIGTGAGLVLSGYGSYLRRRHGNGSPQSRYTRALEQGALFTGLLVAMCLAAGLCEFITLHLEASRGLHPSPILANMVLGLVLANRASFKEEMLSLFQVLENAIFTLFFVLAGAHFNPSLAKMVWLGALIFFIARFGAKLVGGLVGGYISQSTAKMGRNIGKMLTTQGAIAIALVIVIQQDAVFAEVSGIITACVLTAVVAAELMGSICVSRALDQAGESSRDRMRLIEFLQEEFIIPHLSARDKWDVLEQLSYFMVKLHPMKAAPQELLAAVRDREESMSTSIGKGIAVPHAKIPEGDQIRGVMALLDPPIDFDAPDDEPVRLVIMIATPDDLAHKHLEVIATITRMMHNSGIREAIFNANSAEEIHEIIDSQEAETFNYFLET